MDTKQINNVAKSKSHLFFKDMQLNDEKIFFSEVARHALLEAKQAIMSGDSNEAFDIIDNLLVAERQNREIHGQQYS